MRIRVSILLGLAVMAVAAMPVSAQQQRRRPVCIDVTHSPHLSFTGRLSEVTVRTEGLASGPERVLILELPHGICVRDEDQFADPNVRFGSIQVYANTPALRAALRRHIGRQVTVEGEGFAAHTAHHYRPLVVQVDRVSRAR